MKVNISITLELEKDSVAEAVVSTINALDWYLGGKEIIKSISGHEVFEWASATSATPTLAEPTEVTE